MERKLASVQRIAEIKPIDGADAIEAVRINGWWVVTKKGEYTVGDFCVYFEIDSWIPTELAPFLTQAGREPKEFNGVKGEKLRTVRLRGQLSQGLVLPIDVLGDNIPLYFNESGRHAVGIIDAYVDGFESVIFEGEDVTGLLGIQKWEAPENAGTASMPRGNFPSFIPKTDQERVQNINRNLESRIGESFEVTIKIDGSSLTAYRYNGVNGVCSRNIDLLECEGNAFWDIAKKESLHDKIAMTGRNLAIQGELIAPNIQKNFENVKKPEFHCFSIFDIDAGVYLLPLERRALCEELNIPHVPVLNDDFVLRHTVQELLDMAEGVGMNVPNREGIVFKSNTSQFSFKAVSNSYLLKQK